MSVALSLLEPEPTCPLLPAPVVPLSQGFPGHLHCCPHVQPVGIQPSFQVPPTTPAGAVCLTTFSSCHPQRRLCVHPPDTGIHSLCPFGSQLPAPGRPGSPPSSLQGGSGVQAVCSTWNLDSVPCPPFITVDSTGHITPVSVGRTPWSLSSVPFHT